MKIVKHTFIDEEMKVENDEIITEEHETEMCFSLPLSALGLFEEEYGKPLTDIIIEVISNENSTELDQIKFSRALASCMYLKVDNYTIVNNETTKDEFKNSKFYNSVASDIILRNKLIECVIECINDKAAKNNKNNDNPKGKK